MTLSQLAEQIGAAVHGDGSATVDACAPIDEAESHHVTFLANAKYTRFLETTSAAAVIVAPDVPCPDSLTRLVADDPYFAFRNAMVVLHDFRPHPPAMDADPNGVSPRAAVHPEADLGADVVVHPFVTIERGARIGDRTVLYPGAWVGPDAVIGADCLIYPNVTIYDRCRIGDRVTLHSACVVGHDGFGYATHDGVHEKIPQHGVVIIEDDVELGAGCAIERAAMGATRIGRGAKFADLISIGHGVTVGEGCLFVSLVGISGSVEVGRYVALGGQTGVTGHLRIGDFVQAAGKSAIVSDVPDGMKVGGVPAVPLDQAKRNALASMNLYEMERRVRALERELAREKERRPSAGADP